MAVSAAAHPWSPPSRLASCSQGWKKPVSFLISQVVYLFFFGFFGVLGVFWFFGGLFGFFNIFAQKREFLGFFQFQEYF
jgi:hypothetical protein